MRFLSTRGTMPPASFSDILLEGLAPDGGLTVPEYIPQIHAEDLERWRPLSYPELAQRIIGLFWTDICPRELALLCHRAYGTQFRSPETVPLQKICDAEGADANIFLLGLSEGPTLAFKDMAMQFLGEAIPYVLAQRQTHLNIIGATSGDTGSAAEYAFRSKERIQVFMLSPHGRMSDFQRAQMYSLTDKNIHNITVEGVFDDCQHLVKHLSSDLAFKAEHSLGTVNSINLGRIVAQVVYYVWGWLRSTDAVNGSAREGYRVQFAVPSGNFGNIFAGYLAKRMGVPIQKLILATNENNVLEEFFTTGVYRPRSSAQTLATSSPSMDISKASNLERFIYYLLEEDSEKLVDLWEQLETEGYFDLSGLLPQIEASGFVSGASSHAQRVRTIERVYAGCGIIVDPHTADGVCTASRFAQAANCTLVLETAKPQKFAETVVEALGRPAEEYNDLRDLLQREQRSVHIACDDAPLREYIAQHSSLINTPAEAETHENRCDDAACAAQSAPEGSSPSPANTDEEVITQAARDIAEVAAVEIITAAAVHLLSAAAIKCGLAENPEEETDLDEARKLINALAGLITAGAPEISDVHARSLRDGLRSVQLAFREASTIPDAPGEGPGEKWTGPVI